MAFTYRFAIPENELDEIGNWHSPNFFFRFAETRIAFFESLGIYQNDIKNIGLATIAVSLKCNYIIPFHSEETALIEIESIKLGRSSIEFSYNFYRESDPEKRICAKGKMVQVFLDLKTRKSAPIPLEIAKKISVFLTKDNL